MPGHRPAEATVIAHRIRSLYIARSLESLAYRPRPSHRDRLALFTGYLRERVAAIPTLIGSRLWREIRECCLARQLQTWRQRSRPVSWGYERDQRVFYGRSDVITLRLPAE